MRCAPPPPARGEGGSGVMPHCGAASPPSVLGPFEQPNSGARSAKENGQTARVPAGPGDGVLHGRALDFSRVYTKRLSATDISALASMKNVAKCDTWCELQNPVNHRVFERKLRPTPSGRGHVCLGVTHRRPPHLRPKAGVRSVGADAGLPCAPARG